MRKLKENAINEMNKNEEKKRINQTVDAKQKETLNKIFLLQQPDETNFL